MAKISQVSFYAIDPNGNDPDLENCIGHMAELNDLDLEQLHIRESREFEWNDDLPINYENCDLKCLESYFDHERGIDDGTDSVKIGGYYRHFKGEKVKVLAVARDTEYGNLSVIYEYMPTQTVWSRPLAMFLSDVDHDKYPEVEQEKRFQFLGFDGDYNYEF